MALNHLAIAVGLIRRLTGVTPLLEEVANRSEGLREFRSKHPYESNPLTTGLFAPLLECVEIRIDVADHADKSGLVWCEYYLYYSGGFGRSNVYSTFYYHPAEDAYLTGEQQREHMDKTLWRKPKAEEPVERVKIVERVRITVLEEPL